MKWHMDSFSCFHSQNSQFQGLGKMNGLDAKNSVSIIMSENKVSWNGFCPFDGSLVQAFQLLTLGTENTSLLPSPATEFYTVNIKLCY